MSYRLDAVRVFVHNWVDCLEFYQDKIGLPVGFADEAMGWAQLEAGPAALRLERVERGDPEGDKLVGRFVGVSLEVDNHQATYDALVAKGVEFDGPPESQPWGDSLAHFRDPDGNVITLLGS